MTYWDSFLIIRENFHFLSQFCFCFCFLFCFGAFGIGTVTKSFLQFCWILYLYIKVSFLINSHFDKLITNCSKNSRNLVWYPKALVSFFTTRGNNIGLLCLIWEKTKGKRIFCSTVASSRFLWLPSLLHSTLFLFIFHTQSIINHLKKTQ